MACEQSPKQLRAGKELQGNWKPTAVAVVWVQKSAH